MATKNPAVWFNGLPRLVQIILLQIPGVNQVVEIVIHDDIAQGPDAPIEDKRGLGGVIPFIKVVGAAAEAGKSLDEIVELANKFNEGIATLSVALKVATHPQNGGEIGALADDEMEIGMGQHGEGGGGISKMCTADETVAKMVPSLVEATGVAKGDLVDCIILDVPEEIVLLVLKFDALHGYGDHFCLRCLDSFSQTL